MPRTCFTKNGHKKHVCMQTVIMNPPVGMLVDHINMDRLDNRRSNLRICTNQQNRWNTKIQSNNTTGIKGVYFSKQRRKFVAQIKFNGKFKNLGGFPSAAEAAEAYRIAAIDQRGEFVRFA